MSVNVNEHYTELTHQTSCFCPDTLAAGFNFKLPLIAEYVLTPPLAIPANATELRRAPVEITEGEVLKAEKDI
jgi:hypothetical protein